MPDRMPLPFSKNNSDAMPTPNIIQYPDGVDADGNPLPNAYRTHHHEPSAEYDGGYDFNGVGSRYVDENDFRSINNKTALISIGTGRILDHLNSPAQYDVREAAGEPQIDQNTNHNNGRGNFITAEFDTIVGNTQGAVMTALHLQYGSRLV